VNKDELASWLIIHQRKCPGCGARSTREHDLHHLWHRRLKQVDPLLWATINISLVCNPCHVPESKDLNYLCALQKFELGITTPENVLEWLANLPLKVQAPVPAFFYRARLDWGNGITWSSIMSARKRRAQWTG
jgi:hypothetical protein